MQIARKTINCQDTQDIVHIVLESMIGNEKVILMSNDERVYYFTKAIKLQFFSKTSKYHYQYRKNQNKHTDLGNLEYHIIDEYQDKVGMEFVHKSLENLSWFDRDLFLLYIELGTISKVHEQTTIPVNSLGKYLRKTKEFIQQQYKKQL
jgi:hypothetical protein